MFNFSIMRLDEAHLEGYCQDIAYQVTHGIASTPLFIMTLTPEGDPVIDKADMLCRVYEKYKARLDEMGVPSGVLIQASIGHGWKLNEPSAFQKYVGLRTACTPEVCCPADEGFRAYIRAAAKRIAATHPAHIMLDDDFRLMGSRQDKGCACPIHMKRVNALIGKEFSREELYAAIDKNDGESNKYKDAFVKTQIDSLLECAREIRGGIDEIDPHLPGSFCACGDAAEGAYEIASILAGEGNPVILRLNQATYCEKDHRHFSHIMHRAAVEIAALSGKPDVLLAETDTCPQSRYSSSAARLHAHFTFSILEGAKGAKHWITNATYGSASGKAYRKKLEQYAPFYEELSRINDSLTWLGCGIPVPPRPVYAIRSCEASPSGNDAWDGSVLDRFGLPFHYSPKGEGAWFFDNLADSGFTDGELKDFLSGKVVLDGAAALRFQARGLGEYLGVSVRERGAEEKRVSGEIMYPDGGCGALVNTRELTPLFDGVKHYSDAYHLRGGKDKDILFPAVTGYKNALGGTAVVFGGNARYQYNLHEAFRMLNDFRKAQLVQILKDLDCLPVYYPEEAEVLLKAARMADGRMLCAVLDMSLDPVEELPLVFKDNVTAIKRLMPDGSYEPVSFTADGDRYTLSGTAEVFVPLILVIE